MENFFSCWAGSYLCQQRHYSSTEKLFSLELYSIIEQPPFLNYVNTS